MGPFICLRMDTRETPATNAADAAIPRGVLISICDLAILKTFLTKTKCYNTYWYVLSVITEKQQRHPHWIVLLPESSVCK